MPIKKELLLNSLKVDRRSPKIIAALNQSPVYIFKKQGLVKARPAMAKEIVVTRLKNGVKETTNIACNNDWIVTNPLGEQYIISEEKFFNRYSKTSQAGIYKANGYCRAIKNIFGRPIKIIAAWGTPQIGDKNCLIADTCGADGRPDNEPYLIEAKAFAKTYKIYKTVIV